MAKATLIRTTFNWDWLTGPEVQSIFKAGTWQLLGRPGADRAENSTSSSEDYCKETDFQAARMRVLSPYPQ